MAKRGVPTHPKTFRLARKLGIESWAAVGLLECFWHWCSVHAMTGVISAEAEDLADGLRYGGDAAQLLDALVASGWVDRLQCGKLVVHDASQHADNTWKANLKRAGLAFWDEASDADVPTVSQPSGDSRATESQQNHNSVTTESQRSNEPPEPEPEPEPLSPQSPPTGGGSGVQGGEPALPEPRPPRSKRAPPMHDAVLASLPPAFRESDRFRAAWAAFCQARGGAAGWKPPTVEARVREWSDWGVRTTCEALEESVRQGWRGVFKPKQARSSPAGPVVDWRPDAAGVAP